MDEVRKIEELFHSRNQSMQQLAVALAHQIGLDNLPFPLHAHIICYAMFNEESVELAIKEDFKDCLLTGIGGNRMDGLIDQIKNGSGQDQRPVQFTGDEQPGTTIGP